jgi:hypothetical protein
MSAFDALVAGVAVAALGAAGCSNLDVKKVPVADRETHQDHQQGFRYYLNRPYLVVKKPILVTEVISLVKVDPALGVPPGPGEMPEVPPQAGDPARARLTFLDGPRRGQSVSLADLRIDSPGSDALRPVRPEELRKIGDVLAAARHTPPPARPPEPVLLTQGQVAVGAGGFFATAPAAPVAAADLGEGTVGGGAFANTGSVNTDSLTVPTPTTPAHAPPLTGDMEVVYLPDLDEQYVVKSCNWLAKSAFGLAFKNGSELTEVQGEHDSTTLTLSILEQIQGAIDTAKGVEEARIQREAKTIQAQQPKPAGAKSDLGDLANVKAARQQPVWQMVVRTWIKPGVYRLNKPWEVGGGPGAEPVGCGLLAKLGLPTVSDVDFRPVANINPAK